MQHGGVMGHAAAGTLAQRRERYGRGEAASGRARERCCGWPGGALSCCWYSLLFAIQLACCLKPCPPSSLWVPTCRRFISLASDLGLRFTIQAFSSTSALTRKHRAAQRSIKAGARHQSSRGRASKRSIQDTALKAQHQTGEGQKRWAAQKRRSCGLGAGGRGGPTHSHKLPLLDAPVPQR